jgi:hypothetical protein
MKEHMKRHVCAWEDNIKIDLGGTVWELSNWIHLGQRQAFVKTVKGTRVS